MHHTGGLDISNSKMIKFLLKFLCDGQDSARQLILYTNIEISLFKFVNIDSNCFICCPSSKNNYGNLNWL